MWSEQKKIDTTYEVYQKLTERGVPLEDIAYFVFTLRIHHHPEINFSECMDAVKNALRYQNVQHAVLVGVEMDELIQGGKMSSFISEMLKKKEMKVDEDFFYGIVQSFGETSKQIYRIWDRNTEIINFPENCNVFLDDIIAMIASISCEEVEKLFSEEK